MSTVPANIVAKPSYLAELPKDDFKDMKKFMSPPRIKFVQGQTGAPFKPDNHDGDVLVIPQMIKVADLQTEFTFVPIHFFPTWTCTNPWEMKNSLPFIREMSFEEDSDIAKKARAFISEPCPENHQYQLKYSQVMNFFIRIQGIEGMPDDPITLILNRGEFNSGRILIDLITKRDAPRYVSQFNAIPAFRTGKKGNWYGPNFRNAPEPWVSGEKVVIYRDENARLKDLIEKRLIQIDMDDSDLQGDDPNAKDEKKF